MTDDTFIQDLHFTHPGRILATEFLDPLGISQNRLATELRVPAPRINAIVAGKRAITPDTALRLGRFFGMDPQFWLNLQAHYDLATEAEALGGELGYIRPLASVS